MNNNLEVQIITTNINEFSSKQVNAPSNIINGCSTSSRRTIFVRGADIEHIKIYDMLSRNSKTNSFQKGQNIEPRETSIGNSASR
jgi:hypothetical protein